MTRGFRKTSRIHVHPFSPLENMRVDTLSGESSPYLKHYNSTHTLPSVEPVDLLSRLGCGLSLGIEIFTLATGVTYSLVLALL